MNKLTPLILFASMFAASCSSSFTPSIDVGDNRIALSTSMSSAEVTASDKNVSDVAGPETSSNQIELTVGRILAANLEVGAMLVTDSTETTYNGWLGAAGAVSELTEVSVGVYGRYYLSELGGMLPWVQGAILTGSHEETDRDSFGSSTLEADMFTTAMSVGVTSFLSENAGIEFALTKRLSELSSFTLDGLADTYDTTIDQDSVDFTMGLSIHF